MNGKHFPRNILFFLLILLGGWMIGWAHTNAAGNARRVWVQYKPGRKAAVREALAQMGAVFNYDFGDLNAFVVSLPEGALQQVARHPDVTDHWFAQASKKSPTDVNTAK